MSEQVRDGGPAFPRQDVWLPRGSENFCQEAGNIGMSLRDYFASHALVGLARSLDSQARRRYRDGVQDGHEAQIAYALADAMLVARELSNEKDQARECVSDAEPELLAALTALANEASGFLELANMDVHGVTNMNCLRRRIEQARAAIAKAEGRS